MSASSITLHHHTAGDVPPLLDALVEAYADAYGFVEGEDLAAKHHAFRDRARRALEAPRYALVTAQTKLRIVGFAFGYSLRPDTNWWQDLTPTPPAGFTDETGSRTVVLAEIEVRQAWQGQGIGRQLHDTFLSTRTEGRATLATGPKADAARRRYEAWAWQQLGTVPGASGDYFDAYTLYIRPLPLSV